MLFSRPPLEGEAKEQAVEQALAKYDLAEQQIEGDWVFGDDWTLADNYLSVFSRWARQAKLLDAGRYPKLNAHLDRVQERPAIQRMLKAEDLEPVVA